MSLSCLRHATRTHARFLILMALISVSRAMQHQPKVLMQGWMEKEGKNRNILTGTKTWTKRWFELTPKGEINYYTGKDNDKKGCINLSGIKSIGKFGDYYHNGFAIFCPGRTWFLQCLNFSSMMEWIRKIKDLTELPLDKMQCFAYIFPDEVASDEELSQHGYPADEKEEPAAVSHTVVNVVHVPAIPTIRLIPGEPEHVVIDYVVHEKPDCEGHLEDFDDDKGKGKCSECSRPWVEEKISIRRTNLRKCFIMRKNDGFLNIWYDEDNNWRLLSRNFFKEGDRTRNIFLNQEDNPKLGPKAEVTLPK